MTFRKPVLKAGTHAHYLDAAYYDRTYGSRSKDVAFYRKLAKRHTSVLELGAGTGRITLPLARDGKSVTAVDATSEMLTRLRERASKEPAEVQERIVVKRGDFRSVRVGKKFQLVIAPFNAFMHLYTRSDVERALQTVLAHLGPNGVFAFDVLKPDLGMLRRTPDHEYRGRPVRVGRSGERYGYAESFEYDSVAQVELVTMIFSSEGTDDSFVTPLAHRQFFPAELEALLHYNGLRITKRFGDFDGAPLGAESESQVIVAKRR